LCLWNSRRAGDVEVDRGLLGWRVGGAVEKDGFEAWDAVEAPGGVGEFLSEQGLDGSGWLVFIEELASEALVFGGVLGGRHRGVGGWGLGLRGWGLSTESGLS
jgi:hypothetical protein